MGNTSHVYSSYQSSVVGHGVLDLATVGISGNFLDWK